MNNTRVMLTTVEKIGGPDPPVIIFLFLTCHVLLIVSEINAIFSN